MLDLLSAPSTWIALGTLTVMEVVLGIDNIVFISVLVSKLPAAQAERARKLGLALALVFRIALLLVIGVIIGLKEPVINQFGLSLSWKDLILIAGGAFLVYKATHEMHAEIEQPHEPDLMQAAKASFSAIIAQIIVIDMVFSIDSIITAVGMAERVEVMIAAVIIAVCIMFIASGPVARFVAAHPTTKMLALAFLLLIGVTLVIDGFAGTTGLHIDKAYIYAAMAFSVAVEAINILMSNRRKRRALAAGGGQAPAMVVAVDGAMAGKPRDRVKTTPASRAQSRPKSAPRKPKGGAA